jgi:hypothetical protein
MRLKMPSKRLERLSNMTGSGYRPLIGPSWAFWVREVTDFGHFTHPERVTVR